MIGSAGNDYFIDGQPLSYVDGAGGYNTLDFSSDPGSVTLNLATGTATGWFGNVMTVKNIQLVYGSFYYANHIIGAIDTQNISGSIYGGDTITANSAYTQVSFSNSQAAVTVNLTTGVDTGGGAQGDVLTNVDQVGDKVRLSVVGAGD